MIGNNEEEKIKEWKVDSYDLFLVHNKFFQLLIYGLRNF